MKKHVWKGSLKFLLENCDQEMYSVQCTEMTVSVAPFPVTFSLTCTLLPVYLRWATCIQYIKSMYHSSFEQKLLNAENIALIVPRLFQKNSLPFEVLFAEYRCSS